MSGLREPCQLPHAFSRATSTPAETLVCFISYSVCLISDLVLVSKDNQPKIHGIAQIQRFHMLPLLNELALKLYDSSVQLFVE